MSDNSDDDFVKPLSPPIKLSDIPEESSKIRGDNKAAGLEGGNRNSSFGLTVDLLRWLIKFPQNSTAGIAFLLYGDTLDLETGKDPGYNRLMDQRCGRKSFTDDEQKFWYNIALKALGKNVIGHLSTAEFVRTPISIILKRARSMELSIAWDQIDPILMLRILASMGDSKRTPATVTIEKVKNGRLTPQGSNGAGQRFVYSETLPTYQIGQNVTLTVDNLGLSENFAVIEYACRPFREQEGQNTANIGQYWRLWHRNSHDTQAILLNSNKQARLPLGNHGELPGQHGFCVVTYPKSSYGNGTKFDDDPFMLKKISASNGVDEPLISIEELQGFAIRLREMMFRDPDITVNLNEFLLES